MTKEVLAMDVDEVLLPLLQHFLLEHNERHGTDLTRDRFTTYDFDEPLGLSVDETVRLIYEFTASDHSHIDPLDSTQEGIDRLKDRFDIEIITARHHQFKDHTLKWLNEKIDYYFRGIHLVGYAPIMEKPMTKAEICQKIGAIALVDDSLHHVLEMPKIGREGILFGNYPWNQMIELPSGITRCENMLIVADHFGV